MEEIRELWPVHITVLHITTSYHRVQWYIYIYFNYINMIKFVSFVAGLLQQQNWLPWYNWNIVEICINHT